MVPHRVTGEAPVAKLHRAQPWAKRTAPSPSWKPTPKDIFRNLRVICAAIRRAGIRDDDVDDTAADVIGAAWLRLPSFRGLPPDPRATFRGWLNSIAWRIARDRRIREKREHAEDIQEHDDEPLLYPSPHAQVVARFDLRRVGCLSPRYREVAVQLAITGSITDAAAIIRIPLGTCATRTRALRRRLRKWGLR